MHEQPEQIDWISFADNEAQLVHLLCASVERIGIELVAHHLPGKNPGESMSPSALRNQVAGRRGLHEKTWRVCWLLDAQFRHDAAGVTKELLVRPGDLTPEEGLRIIVAKAEASWDKRALSDVLSVYAQVKRGAP